MSKSRPDAETTTAQNERLIAAENGYILEAQGCRFLRTLTEDEYRAVGRTLVRMSEGAAWALGDWLVAGARMGIGPRNGATGSAFKLACEITGYDVEFLRSRWSVAEAYPPDSRRPGLNWTIHRIVMRVLPDLRGPLLSRLSNFTGPRKPATAAEARDVIDQMESAALRATRAFEGSSPPKKRYGKDTLEAQRCEVICPQCKFQFPVKGNKVEKTSANFTKHRPKG